MRKIRSAENQNVGANLDISSKSNQELLAELDAILENCSVEDMDMDKVLESLDALQERAPVMEGRDAKTAWRETAEKYPLVDQIEKGRRKPAKPSRGKWFLQAASAAACILLLVTVTASAMGYDPARSIMRIGEGIVQVFGNPSGVLELPEGSAEYTSLREALDRNNAGDAQCPTWIPEDYTLSEVTAISSDIGAVFSAEFRAQRGELLINIQYHISRNWVISIEKEEDIDAVSLTIDGATYTVIQNAGYLKAFWDEGQYTYSIRGNITEAELKSILKSV